MDAHGGMLFSSQSTHPTGRVLQEELREESDYILFPGLDPEGLFTGGTSSPKLESSGASRERGESISGGEAHWRGFGGAPPKFFFKIYVSENAFQAILKPSFPYSTV